MTDVAVFVEHLTVCFGTFTAVDDLTFQVNKGEIFGFLGANGAGKTTTIRVLCGLLTPQSGQASVAGFDVKADALEVKRRVGYMSQRFTLYDDLTVEENLRFTAQLHKLDKSVYLNRRQHLLDFISFDRKLNTLVKNLPGGIKQQVSLAAALLHQPEVVFLDEPTAGVTPAYRARFWALIGQLSEQGCTVFVTTHYMDEAEQCGRIALMKAGQLIALDTPQHLKEASFPRGLWELEPIKPLSSQDLAEWQQSQLFSLFEPYGMRYHVELKGDLQPNAINLLSDQSFHVRPIHPSLEDVFIRLVEGNPS